ncbi:GNAT family N-acetyltransferase [Streptomyces sp. NPDC058000]|uniref:GNAT family N-acetyltransferase n=1 Tax=Streptomyces sp. NPDC058000 TaxID=3346299 RepID=UPI0036F0B661
MTLTVRDFRPSDAKAVADLRRAALPYLLATPQGVAWQVTSAPPAQRLRSLVAAHDGRVIGQINAGLLHERGLPGQSAATPIVHPDHRGRGAGSALLADAEAHLTAAGATRLHARTVDEPGSLAFAARHGYRPTRRAGFLRLALAHAALPPLPAALPPGVRLCTGADFGADPRPLYEADAEAMADEPGEVAADAVTYSDWLRTTWENPDIDLGLTTVVTVDGEVAAYTLAATDNRGRYLTTMTGCRRAFRGRGLAKLAKTDALHRAREAGCTEAFAVNATTDSTNAANAAMLAINRAFGYRRCGGEVRHVRELGRG